MMLRNLAKRVLLLLCVPALCWPQMGCVLSHSRESSATPPYNPLTAIARGTISWKTDALPPFDEPTFAFRLPKDSNYFALNAHDCQCLAVENSSVGELLEKESQKYERQTEAAFGQFRQVPRFKAKVLHYSSLEARNQTAGIALRLFYQLAELEALQDIAKQSLGVLQKALEQEEKLKAKGLRVPADFADLHEKYFGVQSDVVRIQDGIQQINRELGKLLGIALHPTKDRFWPIADYAVADLHLNVEAEVAEATAQRPQVLMGRYVDANLTVRTLPAALTLLKSYNSLVGLAGSAADRSFLGQSVLILTGIKRRELNIRSEQLGQVNKERERELAQEIAKAVQAIERQANLIILAKAQEQYWAKQTHDLNEKWELGRGNFGELTSAKLKWMQSRSTLVKEVMGWHQAVVKWKEEKGVLVYECGYSQHGNSCAGGANCKAAPMVHVANASPSPPRKAPEPAEKMPTHLPAAILTFQEIAPAVTPDELDALKPPR